MSMSKRHFETQQQQQDAEVYFSNTIQAFADDLGGMPAPGDEDRLEFFNSARALLNHLTDVVNDAENEAHA